MHSLGSKVTIQSGDLIQYQELLPTRGYQSMVESIVHFGVGQLDNIESVSIEWPDGKKQILLNVAANQVLAVDYAEAISDGLGRKKTASTLFVENASKAGIDFVHQENTFDDYDKQILLPHKLSQFGPFVAKGDVNGDQLEDIFVGGASGQAGAVYVQKTDGTFMRLANSAFVQDKAYEDMHAAFFDADSDGDEDIYIVSGGNANEVNSPMYYDRLYLNKGKGKFSPTKGKMPNAAVSGSCVKPFDFDGDGDLDLFIGGRHVPHNYPSPAPSRILENKGGQFVKLDDKRTPDFYKLGMVTDAVWTDFDSDGSTDLIVCLLYTSPSPRDRG